MVEANASGGAGQGGQQGQQGQQQGGQQQGQQQGGQQQQQQQGQQQQASEFAWLGEGQIADETKGFIQNKGWKNGADAVSGYQNLEKLLGADRAGRTVILPKDAADKDGWNALYAKLGRPETADKYDVAVPKGVGDEAYAKEARTWFHELGLSAAQAKSLVEKHNAFVDARITATNADTKAKSEAGVGKLKSEWGAAYDQNVAVAQKAAKSFGFSKEVLDAVESVAGYDGVFKMMHSIGSKMGEAEFVTGDTVKTGGVLTPEQAKTEIAARRRDSEFIKKYTQGDVAARQEMERLHKMAYPEAT